MTSLLYPSLKKTSKDKSWAKQSLKSRSSTINRRVVSLPSLPHILQSTGSDLYYFDKEDESEIIIHQPTILIRYTQLALPPKHLFQNKQTNHYQIIEKRKHVRVQSNPLLG